MKIVGIETIVVSVPMVISGQAPKLGGVPRTRMETLLVRVDTDEGVSGWGEGFGHRIYPATKAAIDTFIAPLCIGRDPTAITALVDDLQRSLAAVGRSGPAMYGLSAIDIALWDLAGKLAGLPLYRLLGGSPNQTVPAYASLLRYGDPLVVTEHVERALAQGYEQIKLHEITVEAIGAARNVIGPGVPLMVDCSWRWSVREAIEMARAFAPFDLKWLEEPVFPPDDIPGLRRVQQEGGIPIAAGENATPADFRHLFELGAISYAQPSVTKIGGISQLRKVIALGEAFGVSVVPHSAYFGPGLLASIHCVAAMSGPGMVERYEAEFESNPYHGAIDPDSHGRLPIPQGPGLGIDPDPAVIREFRLA